MRDVAGWLAGKGFISTKNARLGDAGMGLPGTPPALAADISYFVAGGVSYPLSRTIIIEAIRLTHSRLAKHA